LTCLVSKSGPEPLPRRGAARAACAARAEASPNPGPCPPANPFPQRTLPLGIRGKKRVHQEGEIPVQREGQEGK